MPEAPINLNGYNITIMNAGHALFDQDPFLEQYAGADKTAKQAAWREVEAAYNCTISVEAYPDEAPWGPARVQWINNNANNTKGGADYYIITTTWLNQFSASKALYPVQDLYLRYGENSMGPADREAATYKGDLFAMSPSNYGANYIDRGLFYNVNLLEEVGVENPAQMFMSDRWHYSDFEQWVLDAQVAIGQKSTEDEKYYAIAGRPFFYWAGMINATGIKMVDTASASLNLDGPIQRTIVNLLRKIYRTIKHGTQFQDMMVKLKHSEHKKQLWTAEKCGLQKLTTVGEKICGHLEIQLVQDMDTFHSLIQTV